MRRLSQHVHPWYIKQRLGVLLHDYILPVPPQLVTPSILTGFLMAVYSRVAKYLRVREGIASVEQFGTCTVCLEKQKAVCLVDCGHVCTCVQCTQRLSCLPEKLQNCPICRVPISSPPVTIYYSEKGIISFEGNTTFRKQFCVGQLFIDSLLSN